MSSDERVPERSLVWLAGGGHHPGLPAGLFLGSPGSVPAWRYPDGHLELAELPADDAPVAPAETGAEPEQQEPQPEPVAAPPAPARRSAKAAPVVEAPVEAPADEPAPVEPVSEPAADAADDNGQDKE